MRKNRNPHKKKSKIIKERDELEAQMEIHVMKKVKKIQKRLEKDKVRYIG